MLDQHLGCGLTRAPENASNGTTSIWCGLSRPCHSNADHRPENVLASRGRGPRGRATGCRPQSFVRTNEEPANEPQARRCRWAQARGQPPRHALRLTRDERSQRPGPRSMADPAGPSNWRPLRIPLSALKGQPKVGSRVGGTDSRVAAATKYHLIALGGSARKQENNVG